MASKATDQQQPPVRNQGYTAVPDWLDLRYSHRIANIYPALLERAEMGREKYGTYLTTNNGRDAQTDALQKMGVGHTMDMSILDEPCLVRESAVTLKLHKVIKQQYQRVALPAKELTRLDLPSTVESKETARRTRLILQLQKFANSKMLFVTVGVKLGRAQ